VFVIIIFLFYNDNFSLTPIATPNTLEFMIEYMLISSILNRICEMTKKPLEYLRNDSQFIPLQPLLKITTWGTKWKKGF
jgi:hypothetical protein